MSLNRCPFCGSDKIRYQAAASDSNKVSMECQACEAMGPSAIRAGEAMSAWNSRICEGECLTIKEKERDIRLTKEYYASVYTMDKIKEIERRIVDREVLTLVRISLAGKTDDKDMPEV